MAELQTLRADHAQSILAFELTNHAYFAASISDRGDAYFQEFGDRYNALLAKQASGIGAYYVLADDDGSVMGRFNLLFVGDGAAELGYRVAASVAGRGVATATVRDICQLASERRRVRIVRAAASQTNIASQRVLVKAGFAPAGATDPTDLGRKVGTCISEISHLAVNWTVTGRRLRRRPPVASRLAPTSRRSKRRGRARCRRRVAARRRAVARVMG